jgi:hypothetical protein
MMHNREFTSSFWFITPACRDHIPNRVMQPLVLGWVRWPGRFLTASDTGNPVTQISKIIRRYPCEDLIIMGKSDQVAGSFVVEGHTLKEVIARE